MTAGLGQAELEFVLSMTAPLYWIIHDAEGYRVRNGSAFFLNTGGGVFAVTANHVIEGWKRDCVSSNIVALQLGHDLQIDFDEQHGFIAAHQGMLVDLSLMA